MGLENILTLAEAVGWVWGCMIIALLASVLSFVSMLLFAFVFALMEVSLPLLSTSTITALVLMCAYSHHFFLAALGVALPHGMLLLYNHQRLNNRRLHRSQVCVTVLLLQQIMGQLVPLVQGSDGSAPKPHLSQTDKSLSEFGPRVLRGHDSVNGDRFGRAVALGPDLALVAADSAPCSLAQPGGECHHLHRGPGAVYIYERDWVDVPVAGYAEAGYRHGSRWWGLRRKLEPPDAIPGQRFGASVALDPVMHTAVVAAPLRPLLGKNESGVCASEGHVCECYGQVRFGHVTLDTWAPSIAVHGSVMCIHQIFDDPAPGVVKLCECTPTVARQLKNDSGAVYVYQQDHGGSDAWGLVNVLTLENTTYAATHGVHGQEYFGSSVAVSGRHILVGCPRCHGRNVREISAGVAFLYHCVTINESSSQCVEWNLLKELVPEPDGTQAPTWCKSVFAGTQIQADWTCHREMDNFGNSVAVMGCCNAMGQLLVADGQTGRRNIGTSTLRQDRALCDMIHPCPEAVVAVGAFMESTSDILGEGYDRGRHGAVYLYDNRAADDVFAQAKNLTSSGRNESDFVQQSQRFSAMDEDEDTMFGKHVSLSACTDDFGGDISVCLAVSRTTCRDRVCRTPLSPTTGIAICHCEPSEHGYADEMYVFQRHRNARDSWGLQHKYCDRNFSCPLPPNCTELYATADKRVPYEVLQTHDGPGDAADERSTLWPGPRDTAHTFLDSGPGSRLGQGAGANPNGDQTRTDYDCSGADAGGVVNRGPCVEVPCTPFGLQVKDLFFGNPAQVLGDFGIVGDFSWKEQGVAYLVPRNLLSEQRVLDFTWIPYTLDILHG